MVSPKSQQAIIKSIDKMARDMIKELNEADNIAVAKAQADPNIEVVAWSTEEIDKFRNIAKDEWEKYAAKSPKSKLVYDMVTKYLGL